MSGNFAPVAVERTSTDLPVEGELPGELDGCYVRNGPNPRSGTSPHWLVGDGMVHGVAISGGRARWYRNRYVGAPAEPRGPGPRRLGRGRNNTHVIEHAGRLLALVEADLPLELDAELTTIGPFDFSGAITGPVTAHPKRCPRTGELHFFGYQFEAPHLVYYVADAHGRVTARRTIDVDGASYLHDFALTEHHAIFFDTPARMIADWGSGVPMPFRWEDDRPTRIAVVPRDSGAVRWFEAAPCVLGHVANGFERDGRIAVDGIRYSKLDVPPPVFNRWEIDLRPVVSSRHHSTITPSSFRASMIATSAGHTATPIRSSCGSSAASRPARCCGATTPSPAPARRAISGAAQMPGECAVVGWGAADDAWLLTFVYDAGRGVSDLVVLDARELAVVARVRLPERVPFGFHGSWVPSSGTRDRALEDPT